MKITREPVVVGYGY